MVTRQMPLQPQQPPSASPSVRGANQEREALPVTSDEKGVRTWCRSLCWADGKRCSSPGVLFHKGPRLPQHPRNLAPARDCFSRIMSVLKGILVTLWGAWGHPAMHSASAVRHRCRPAPAPAPCPGSASRAAVHGQFASHGVVPPILLDPPPWGLDHAHHRLPASMHMDVLNRDLLLTLATMAVKRLDQSRVSASELVGLVQVLAPALESLFCDHGAPITFHRGVVGGEKLSGEHAFHLIFLRPDAD